MSVRAKFVVSRVSESVSWSGRVHETSQVELSAVCGDDNKTWSKWTPSGKIEMQINNPDALKQFKIGETYFVDFTPAPSTEAEEK